MRTAPVYQMLKCQCLLLLSLACCVGCHDPQRAKLVGQWELERPERIASRIEGSPSPSVITDSTSDSETESGMTLKFAANGTFQTRTLLGNVNREKNGTWNVISLDEETGQMTIKCKIGAQETSHPIEFVDGSSIRLLPPNLAGLTMKMQFRRAD